MGEGDYGPAMIYECLEETALKQPDPKVIEAGNMIIISKDDYSNLLLCREAAKLLKEASENFFEAWYDGGRGWQGSSMARITAYSSAFSQAVIEANNFRTSIFYKLWRKLNPKKKWKWEGWNKKKIVFPTSQK
jgi:hypothetical protein